MGLSALCVCGRRRLSSVEVYDPGTGEWSAAAALTTARSRHSCVVLEGKLWVEGGSGGDGR